MWLIVGGVILVVLVVYLTCILPTSWVDVVYVDSKVGINKRGLQITDIHVEMLRVHATKIVEIAKNAKIDYIFITGDFLTDERRLPKLEAFLQPLQALGVPMYAVLGNHDYRVRPLTELLSLLHNLHIVVLRNEAIRLEDFWLIGIDDLRSGKSDVEASFRDVPKNEPKVVLAHDPNLVLQIHHRFDYLMSGHLHGKQFQLPFLFHVKNMGPLPKKGIYKGLHNFPEGPIYISKGLSQVGLNARFLVRCELTVHQL